MKVSSSSTGSSSSSMLSCDAISAVSTSSSFHGGDPDDLKMPEAAAWVSVGELREAEGLWPLELRAMRMWDGFVVIAGRESIGSPFQAQPCRSTGNKAITLTRGCGVIV